MAGQTERRHGRSALALLAVLALLVQLPFLGQAFHIDDNLYLMVAENWSRRPWAPQDLSSYFEGLYVESFISHEHPLLLSSLLLLPALRAKPELVETTAHGIFFAFYLLLILSAYRLARRMEGWALFGAALTALSPAVFVSSHTVMLDLPYTALLYAGLSLASDRAGRLRIWAAAVAEAGAVMLAYQAVFFVPVVCWGFRRPAEARPEGSGLRSRAAALARKAPWPLWALPAVVLILYGLAYSLYFQRFIWWDLVAFWRAQPDSGGGAPGKLVHSALTLLACLVFPLAWAAWLRRDSASGSPALESRQTRLLHAMIGVNAFAVLLAFQVGAVRYWLPAAPALCLLTTARLRNLPWTLRMRAAFAGLLLALTAGLSLGLALADREWAGFYRRAASETAAMTRGEEKVWFTAEWGFRWYLTRAGGQALGRGDNQAMPGDLLVRPRIASPYRTLYDRDPETLRLERIIEYRPSSPFRLLDFDSGAGFYSSGWGWLPFSIDFSGAPLERIAVYRVNRGVEPVQGEPTYWQWNQTDQ